MNKVYLIIIAGVVGLAILTFIIIKIVRHYIRKKLLKGVNKLEVKKNTLNSMPVMVELSKIEEIAKSEQLEEKINDFKVRYQEVKDVRLTKINDMIIDLDITIQKHYNIKDYTSRYSDIEMELDKAECSLNSIIKEIDEIASYEEKYRDIVTKLKAKYRFLEHSYTEKETLLMDLKEPVKMQFENIAKRFQDFDKVMEEKLYNEVVLVVNSIDTMIDNLDVIIKELPDILLLVNDLIPGRIKDLNLEYQKMRDEGYPLAYLNYESNISDIEKKETDIITRAKVLNITDSLFDLRTILEYLDSLFKDLEEEKKAKQKFDSLDEIYISKHKKLDKIVKDIYEQLDDIKALYHLTEKDLEIIEELNLKFATITKEHKKLLRDIKKGLESYKKHSMTINELVGRINDISEEFDKALRELGSFYEDEIRAHEELKNMNEILRKCKDNVRNNRLPIIYDNYYIEVSEAEDAIKEVIKELENKPIIIKNLNTRVDTARDLVIKLNDNTNNMIKYAGFSEILFVYGNKYRFNKDINRGLNKALKLYYQGSYKDCFTLLMKAIKLEDAELIAKINKLIKN